MPERREVGEGLFGRGDVGLGNDLHERGAGAVEINAAGCLEVEALGHILLQMDAGEADRLAGRRDRLLHILRVGRFVQRNAATEAERLVILGDLIVLRHVRVVVVLAVELADLGNVAAKHKPCTGGETQCLAVHHRKSTGQPKTSGACVRVRFGPILDFAPAEHLALGF